MNRLLFPLSGTLAFLLLNISGSLYAHPIEGEWKTFDDKTGEPKSIIDIYVDEGRLYGKIIEIFPEEGEDPDPLCEECRGELKNQKIIGMVIINGLEEKDGTWAGGKILDPENGKSYRCKLWMEDGALRVRGSLLVFHRTQTWVRPESHPQDDINVESRSTDLGEKMPEETEEDSTVTRPE